MKRFNLFEKIFVFVVFTWILFYLLIKFGETAGVFFEAIKRITN